jgi:16S rRNA G1207 methylase RsmC
MIEKSKDFLKPGGTLQIVARHNKGGKSLSEKMNSVFGNVEDIAKKSGYRIYISKN